MNTDSTSFDIFREIFEKSSAALLLISAEGDIVMLNDSFCKMSGYTKEELIGTKWATKVPPEDVEKFKEFNRRRLMKDPNVPNDHELRYFTKKGKLKYALFSASLIEQTSQTICTFLDITERKAFEEEVRVSKDYYQLLVEYAGDIIFSMSPGGYFNYISPVMQEKLGYSIDDFIGVPFNTYVHPEDNFLVLQCFELVVTKKKKLSGLEFRIKHKNGKWHWLSISATPIVNEEGEITSIIGVGNDITQRKKIEKALQRSEKLLWTLFNSIPDMIWLKDSDGVFVACNKAFQKIIGKDKNEIVGKTGYDIFSRDVADFVTQMDKKVMAANKVSRYEEEIFFSGINKKILLDTLKTPVYSAQQELIGVLGIARDITDRKQMEEKLSESLTFFKESQQAGFIGSYKYHFDTQKWEASEMLTRIYGINPGNISEITSWDNNIHPEDKERIVSGLKETIEQGKNHDAYYRIIRKTDKKIRWVHGIGKIICDENGNKQFLIGTVQDITERKLAEEAAFENRTKLNIALKMARLGPWEYNVDENLFYFNDTFYALYKTNSKQMGGETMTIEDYSNRFIHPDDHDLARKEIQKSINSQKLVYIKQIEHRILYANGEEGYVTVQVVRIKDKNGRIVKVFGINQDITAAKQAEKELRDSAEELRELNATKDKLFSIIAHDLIGPFTTISGFSELLLSNAIKRNPENIRRYSQYILGSSKKVMDLLMNLLEWSRSETGRMEFKPEPINLIEIINNTIELLMPTAKQKKITLKPLQKRKVDVVADPVMLSVVFRNLISNALKFTYSEGDVKVLIQKKEKELLIKVIDNGVGISEERIKKMFRISQNYSTVGTNEEKGTGLGLMLCKEFVEKHGGKIWVKSQLSKGSEFCFTLPF